MPSSDRLWPWPTVLWAMFILMVAGLDWKGFERGLEWKALGASNIQLTEIEFANMVDWENKGPNDQADWVVATGGRTVQQNFNGLPIFFVTKNSYINVTMMGTIQVATATDDDMVGFSLGYSDPNITPATNESMHYKMILFDWKQFNQSPANAGFGLHHMDGTIKTDVSNDFDYFWTHADATSLPTSGSFSLIASDYGATKGWADFQEYSFRVIHTDTRIKVRIDDVLIFDELYTHVGGKVGFYNYSQEKVIYGNVRLAPASDTPSVPVATADVYGTSLNTAISKNRLLGLTANDYDPNLDLFNITIQSSGNYSGSFSSNAEQKHFQTQHGNILLSGNGKFTYTPATGFQGIDHFSYSIYDAQGQSNTTTFQVAVVDNNQAPTDITLTDNVISHLANNDSIVGYLQATDPNNPYDLHDYAITSQSVSGFLKLTGNVMKIASSSLMPALDQRPTVTVQVSDANGLSFSKTLNLWIADVKPFLYGLGASPSYTENAAATLLDSSVSISDNNHSELIGANVSISGNFNSGDLLAVTSGGNVSASFDATSGLLSLVGQASLGDYASVLGNVLYQSSSENPSVYGEQSTRTLSYQLFDSSSNSQLYTLSLSVLGSNDVPSLQSLDQTPSYTEQASAIYLDQILSVSDVDDRQLSAANVSIQASAQTGDLLSVDLTGSSVTSSWDASQYTLSLNGSANLSDYATLLSKLQFSSSSHDPTLKGTALSRTIQYLLVDASMGSNTSTLTLNLVATNDAPVISGNQSSALFLEGGNVQPMSNLILSDVDDTQLQGANLLLSSLQSGDELSLSLGSGMSGNYNSTTGAFDILGASNILDYQTALRSTSFQSQSDNPDLYGAQNLRSLRLTVFDGSSSNTIQMNLSVSGINDAPSISLTGNATAYEEQTANYGPLQSVSLSDVDDMELSSMVVELQNPNASHDQLSISISGANLSASAYNSSSGNLSISGNGSLMDYQSTLSSLQFFSSSNEPDLDATNGQRWLNVILRDPQGASANAMSSFAVTAVNDLPQFSNLAGGNVGFSESLAQVSVDPDLSISDADHSLLQRAYVLLDNPSHSESLSVTTTGSHIISNYADGNLILQGADSLSQYQTVLRSLIYANSSDNPTQFGTLNSRELNYYLHDGVGLSSNTAVNVQLIEGADAPQLTLSSSQSQYTEGTSLILDAQIQVSDVDSTTLQSAELSITGNFAMGDQLSVTAATGVSATYDGNTGILGLQGSASLGDYQTMLRSLRYDFMGDNPSSYGTHASKVITLGVNDGALWSAYVQHEVLIQDLNDPPHLEIDSTLVSYLENQSTALSLLSQAVISDADDLQLGGANIQIHPSQAVAGDRLQWSVLSSNIQVSHYDESSHVLGLSGNASSLEYAETLKTLSYISTSENPTEGGLKTQRGANLTVFDVRGGSNLSSFTWSVNAVNDPPYFTALGGDDLGFSENVGTLPLDPDLHVGDVDHTTLQGASILLSDPQPSELLSLAQSDPSILVNYSAGNLSLQGNGLLSLYRDLLRTATYSNNSQNPSQFGTIAKRQLQYVLNDGVNSSANTTLDIAIFEGADPPSVQLSRTTATYTEGSNLIIDGSLTLSDVDSLRLLRAKVSISVGFRELDLLNLSSSGNQVGALSWSYSANTGIFELSGNASLAEYQAALRTLNFSMNTAEPDETALQKELVIAVYDGQLWSSWQTFIITVQPVNNVPLLQVNQKLDSYVENSGALGLLESFILADSDDNSLLGANVFLYNFDFDSEQILVTGQGNIVNLGLRRDLGLLELSGLDLLSRYEELFKSLMYIHNSENPTGANLVAQRSVDIFLYDPKGASSNVAWSWDIKGVNDPPVWSQLGGESLTYMEQSGALSLDEDLQLLDVDDAQVQLVQVRLLNPQSTERMITSTNSSNVAVSQLGANLSFTGPSSTTEMVQVLRGIQYENSSSNPTQFGSNVHRYIEYRAYDGADWGETVTLGLEIIEKANAPVLQLEAIQQDYGEHSGAQPLAWGVSISDGDSLELSQARVALPSSSRVGARLGLPSNLQTSSGLESFFDTRSQTLWLQGLKSLALYEQALNGLEITLSGNNPSDYDLAKRLSLTVDVFDGQLWSQKQSYELQVQGINDAPVLVVTAMSNIGYAEGEQPSQLCPSLKVFDDDDLELQRASLQLSSPLSGDELSVSVGDSGLSSTFDAALGVMNITGTANLSVWQSVLRTLEYRSTSLNPTDFSSRPSRELVLTVYDDLLPSNGLVLQLQLHPSNNRPVISQFNASGTYVEDRDALLIDSRVQVSDADSLVLEQAMVYIASFFTAGDQLAVRNLETGLNQVYDATTGVLVISGNANLESYGNALRGLLFQSSSQNPGEISNFRTLHLSVFDGATWSVVQEAQINIFGVNDAPQISVTDTARFVEDQGAVSPLASLNLDDVDSLWLNGAELGWSSKLTGDTWTWTSRFGIELGFSSETKILLTGRASPQQYAEVLRSIRWSSSSDNPDSYGERTSLLLDLKVSDDSGGTGSLQQTLYVVDNNDAPVIRGLQPLQVSVGIGEEWFWNYEVVDPDDLTLLHRTINMPPWAFLLDREKIIKGTVVEQNAVDYGVDLRVTDPGGLVDRKIIELSVQAPLSSEQQFQIRVLDEQGLAIGGAKLRLFGLGMILVTPESGSIKVSKSVISQGSQRIRVEAEGMIPSDLIHRLDGSSSLEIVLARGAVKIAGQVTSGSNGLVGAQVACLDPRGDVQSTTTTAGGNYELVVPSVSINETWTIGASKEGYTSSSNTFAIGPQDLVVNMSFAFDLSQETLLGYEVYKSPNNGVQHSNAQNVYRVYVHAEPDFFPGDEIGAMASNTNLSLSSIQYDEASGALFMDVQVPVGQSQVQFDFSAQPNGGSSVSTVLQFQTDEVKDETEAKLQQMVNEVRGGRAYLSRESIVAQSGNAIVDRSGFELPPYGVSDQVDFIRFERQQKSIQSSSLSIGGAVYAVDAFRTITLNSISSTEKLGNEHIKDILLTFSYGEQNWTPYQDAIYYSENQGSSWLLFSDSGIQAVDETLKTVTIRSDHLSLWTLGPGGAGLIGRAGGGDAGGGCLLK